MLRPSDVEEALGLNATGGHLKGRLRSPRHKALWPDSMWRFGTSLKEDRGLGANLVWVLDHLEPKRDVVRALTEKHTVDFFCGFSSGDGEGGFTLPAAVLRRVAKFEVPLIMNLSPPLATNTDAEVTSSPSTLNERKWSTAALRIIGQELRPEDIEPMHTLGETRFHSPQQWRVPGGGTQRGSLWSLVGALGDKNGITQQLQSLLDSLEPRLEMIRRLSEKYWVDIFCGFSSRSGQGGFILDATTLVRIAALGVPIGVELYLPGPVRGLGIDAQPQL